MPAPESWIGRQGNTDIPGSLALILCGAILHARERTFQVSRIAQTQAHTVASEKTIPHFNLRRADYAANQIPATSTCGKYDRNGPSNRWPAAILEKDGQQPGQHRR